MFTSYKASVLKEFRYYKSLGDACLERLNDTQIHYCPNASSNSIAIMVQHMYGNMRSRWIDFYTSDGEKPWRNRDIEFEQQTHTKQELIQIWNEGWQCVFTILEALNESDMQRTVYIRNQAHHVSEAINRQLAHYPYHVGQMVYLSKLILDANFTSLSIPKNQSTQYNNKLG